ncbi:RNA polymerase sigma factor [Wenyingzhuangia sp. 2_MG-2023]|uniref:RNA polymerase sigma factor n=1 Tax=Wenyingzhuangia sp. 2_MG-2023 TaxID=3062639 RepID=UPI0026E3A9D1|nr:sigma-70 family RNA polymerase sigma factor [Wenyingzhuangia sp. 2_MG-2023]MDO6738748.1 sigma-70 family RNA polymerase sigma factor [Wenyingzhuangia sp. 2_MG-2023]
MRKVVRQIDKKDLIKRVKNSDQQAFQILYNYYFSKVYAFLNSLNLSTYADDVVQETFVILWSKREDLDEEKSFESYLFTIAKNLALKSLRKQIVYQLEEDTEVLEHKSSLVENDAFPDDVEKTYVKILSKLPERAKVVFELKRMYGWSTDQIAEHLDIAPKTVENHMNRALTILKKEMNSMSLLAILLFSK